MHVRALILLVLVISLHSCRKNSDAIRPEVKDIVESVYASAVIKPEAAYRAAASVPGIVARVFVSEGDSVKTGDPLFRIESSMPELDLEKARLAYDQAVKEYRGNSSVLEELELQIRNAREALQLDSLNYIRQKDLWEQSIGARSTLDQRRLAYYNARNNYMAALSKRKQTETRLANALDLARTNYEISRQNRADYTVSARLNGRVYDVYKESGEFVHQQEALALLGRSDDFILEMQVDERDIARVFPGQRVLLTLDSYQGELFEGTVTKLNPVMNEVSQSFVVEAMFTQGPPRLFPNLSAEANIVIATKENALVIPRRYLAGDNKVKMADGEFREVETGIANLDQVEILTGLSSTDEITIPD